MRTEAGKIPLRMRWPSWMTVSSSWWAAIAIAMEKRMHSLLSLTKGNRRWAKRYSEGAYTVANQVVINDQNQIVVTGSIQEDETAMRRCLSPSSRAVGCLSDLFARKDFDMSLVRCRT